ncbi:hypothetical protein HOLleu_43389 [Holothuria leucospilota]|uniref:Uncharacterized protein n=1 Tax=Holothuria leucospilota TaxID=206669 RepID=A0A9Q0YDV0_HOLLE|nr:hypothetical protein HOLleu_43389 [Holothuria leucospilota]
MAVSKDRTSTYENRRFDRCAATLWNNLSEGVTHTSTIHDIKKLLKLSFSKLLLVYLVHFLSILHAFIVSNPGAFIVLTLTCCFVFFGGV